MPYDEADPTDPTMLVGVEAPATEETVVDMAYAFAEEFALMGHDASYILGLFRRPFYAGAYDAYLRLGDIAVQQIIEECVNAFGRIRFTVRDAPARVTARYVIDSKTGKIVVKRGN
jgi:hypothetical protein